MERKKGDSLDLEEIRRSIKSSIIVPSRHLSDVKDRKGRPGQDFPIELLEGDLGKLYKAHRTRNNCIELCFYLSRKYDFVAIVALKQKALKIVTYYFKRKKGKEVIL